MANYDGVVLNPPGLNQGGAVFYLSSPVQQPATVSLELGVEVEMAAKSRAVVVRGLVASSYETVIRDAPEAANRALDLLSVMRGARLALAAIEATHIAWWQSSDGVTIRIQGTSTLTHSISVSGFASDSAGHPMPSQEFAWPAWQHSMRYFRVSQTSTDLFDAFRNLYLALEAVLSTIEPVRMSRAGRPEGEGAWILRALTIAGMRVDLNNYLQTNATSPVEDLKAELYERIRTSIFHAKNGRPVLLPQDSVHRLQVVDALARYSRLYLDLLHSVTGITFPSGGLTVDGFKAMIADIYSRLTIAVTDDPTPAGTSDGDIAPTGRAHVTLPTRRRPELDAPFFAAIGSEVPAEHLSTLPCVRRFGALTPTGGIAQVESLEGSLSIEGFDVFECVLGVRLVNAKQPKSEYES